jgi:hypothetical protein
MLRIRGLRRVEDSYIYEPTHSNRVGVLELEELLSLVFEEVSNSIGK